MLIEEKFMANYFISPGVSQGGRLLISKNEIFFRPHILNIGDLSDKYLKINERETRSRREISRIRAMISMNIVSKPAIAIAKLRIS
jgi:hypothetical protein